MPPPEPSRSRALPTAVAAVLLAAGCAFGPGLEAGAPGPATTALGTGPTTATTAAPPTTAGPSTTTVTTAAAPPDTGGLDDAALLAAGVDELGLIPVLEYHLIEEPEDRWSRTPDNFRADVARLIAAGYYPINLIDLATGHIDVPLGSSPVVLTFDDSSDGQCRYGADGLPDPDSACGILLAAAGEHPSAWRTRATFFVLLDVDVASRVLFGQPEWVERKLRDLVGWGMEIGSHTISHYALDQDSPEQVAKQLALPEQAIEGIVPGYEVRSLSPPFGIYPADESVLAHGAWGSTEYDYEAAVHVAGGPSVSPFLIGFDPLHITRVQATQEGVDAVLGLAADGSRYVSDGDPAVVSYPAGSPARLSLRTDLPSGVTPRVFPAP